MSCPIFYIKSLPQVHKISNVSNIKNQVLFYP